MTEMDETPLDTTDTDRTDTGTTVTGGTDTGTTDTSVDPADIEMEDETERERVLETETEGDTEPDTTVAATESTDGVDQDDPGPPYLFVDQYSLDSGFEPPWATLLATPGFCGAILKAWDGLRFNDKGWFTHNWPLVRDAGGDRYGVSWFRGAYLFLQLTLSGADQADAYLQAIETAGGWDPSGDILPVIDVELGGEKHPNRKASAQQVIDCATECANRLREQTGRNVMLYGRGAMRDLGITNDKMGCDVVWNPSYTSSMVRNGLQAFDLEEIALWQYCGDNFAAFKKLPNTVPGFNKIDISVFIKGAQRPTLQMVKETLIG
ncbi:MAG: lysozyme [Frankiaceae bacterium]|jgi:hypothetical protein|nr:lysozyme [Frankiaceae bacterium]